MRATAFDFLAAEFRLETPDVIAERKRNARIVAKAHTEALEEDARFNSIAWAKNPLVKGILFGQKWSSGYRDVVTLEDSFFNPSREDDWHYIKDEWMLGMDKQPSEHHAFLEAYAAYEAANGFTYLPDYLKIYEGLQ